MLGFRYMSHALAYRAQERAAVSNARRMFHAYHFCRYLGMLRSISAATEERTATREYLLTHDAFKCALLAFNGLSRQMQWGMMRGGNQTKLLHASIAAMLRAIRRAKSDKGMEDLPSMLHLAGLLLYNSLQRRLIDDVNVYRSIVPDESLVAYAKHLCPSVCLSDGVLEEACARTAKVIESKNVILRCAPNFS